MVEPPQARRRDQHHALSAPFEISFASNLDPNSGIAYAFAGYNPTLSLPRHRQLPAGRFWWLP